MLNSYLEAVCHSLLLRHSTVLGLSLARKNSPPYLCSEQALKQFMLISQEILMERKPLDISMTESFDEIGFNNTLNYQLVCWE